MISTKIQPYECDNFVYLYANSDNFQPTQINSSTNIRFPLQLVYNQFLHEKIKNKEIDNRLVTYDSEPSCVENTFVKLYPESTAKCCELRVNQCTSDFKSPIQINANIKSKECVVFLRTIRTKTNAPIGALHRFTNNSTFVGTSLNEFLKLTKQKIEMFVIKGKDNKFNLLELMSEAFLEKVDLKDQVTINHLDNNIKAKVTIDVNLNPVLFLNTCAKPL